MRRRGFTLLELIVATIIFTVIMAAAYALFESSRGVSSRAEFRAQLFQTARAALRAVEEDVRGAMMSGSAFDTGLIGTNGGTADAPTDKLEIVSVNTHTVGAKDKMIDVSKVTYTIDDVITTTARGLARERQKVLTPVTVFAGRDENVEEVAADVVYVNFRYYDVEWKDAWDSTTQNKLPKAIEVTVHVRGEWRGQEFIEKFTSRFYLPVGAETPEKTP
jgi:type II secretion system protein J